MSSFNQEQFIMSGKLAEAIGGKFPYELINVCVSYLKDQYSDCFDGKISNELNNLEKRFIWFSKIFHEFKNKHLLIYPKHWGVLCYIVNELCGEFSIYIAKLLSSLDTQ